MPTAGSSTPCCYKEVNEPPPGQGFPLNVSAGFCHEPDHVQLHLKRFNATSKRAPAGWPAGVTSSTTADNTSGQKYLTSLPQPSTFLLPNKPPNVQAATLKSRSPRSNFHYSSEKQTQVDICDKLLWPSASLNATSEEATKRDTLRQPSADEATGKSQPEADKDKTGNKLV